MAKYLFALTALLIFSAAVVHAQIPAGTFVVAESCIRLYDLPAGTREYPAGLRDLNDEGCRAKQYLLDTRNACSGGQGITGANPKDCIRALDNNFAIRLKAMFEGNAEVFNNVKILSGYRTEQGERLVSGRTTGAHRRGCAVDLSGPTSSNTSCLAACNHIVTNSARLQLKIPYYYSPEYNHIELTTACQGTPGSGPNTQTPMPMTIPTAQVSNMVRQITGMTMPQPINPYQNYSAPVQNPFMYMTPPPLPAPVSNTVPPPITSTILPPPPSPISNLFNEITPPPSNSTTTKKTDVTNSVVSNVAGLEATGKKPTTTQPRIIAVVSGTQQNTFTSNDLRNDTTRLGNFRTGTSTLAVLLDKLKSVLERILTLLKPFGTRPMRSF